MNAKQKKKWERRIKLGKFRFVLLSALSFSLIVSFASSLSHYLIDKFKIYGEETPLFRPTYLLLNFIILFTLWLFFSIYAWNKSEEEYLVSNS